MKGTIFDIQRFCTNDGPGIRTTVFFKGCPLKCIWCHNPESQSAAFELAYNPEKCVNCGKCVDVCPNKCHTFENGLHYFDKSKCSGCGKCLTPLCSALSHYGSLKDTDEILKEVMRDKAFYDNSDGGITLSGGEPLAQPDFCAELLKKSKESGLHTCIETAGFTTKNTIEKVLKYVDIFLFDYKETNPEKHKEFIGQDNKIILENLNFINRSGGRIILRCPLIPGFNDREEHFLGIADIANKLDGITEVQIEPYHGLGSGKYTALGIDYLLKDKKMPENDVVEKWIESIQKHTSKKVSKA